jgi:hypothetical protein
MREALRRLGDWLVDHFSLHPAVLAVAVVFVALLAGTAAWMWLGATDPVGKPAAWPALRMDRSLHVPPASGLAAK